MKTMETTLEVEELDWPTYPEIIDSSMHLKSGREAKVCKHRDFAIKISKKDLDKSFYSTYEISSMQNEYEVATFLYENEIAIPKPWGLFNINFRISPETIIKVPSFIMEYISGTRVDELSRVEVKYNKLEEKANKEIERIRKLGVKLNDFGTVNRTWSLKRKKVYFIDFTGWIIN